jgi:hypothetical protein
MWQTCPRTQLIVYSVFILPYSLGKLIKLIRLFEPAISFYKAINQFNFLVRKMANALEAIIG